MEAGGKDCEEETLQTAFKKLRVDAESLSGASSVAEALVPRAASRPCLDTSGAKPKLGCPKDNWHGCMRKTRGSSRTQRRRRSKSPILHPPKFTYCSAASATALSPSGGGLKHQRLAVPEPADPRPAADGRTASSPSAAAVSSQKELCSSGAPGPISPLVFGSCAEHDGGGCGEARASEEEEGGGSEKSACEGAESSAAGAPRIPGPSDAADFRALSELHSSGGSADGARARCSCAWRKNSDSPEESQCRCGSGRNGDWAGVEVYSFTGLRDVISECERSLPSHEDGARTLGATAAAASSSLTSGSSPRSCSEQARAYVDDITIEDLSGYMEYYLYIPKKMSHMAEMMYT